jgi:hypothetical protein
MAMTTQDPQIEALRARQAEIGQCLAVMGMHGGGDTRELEEELAAIEAELKRRAAGRQDTPGR